MSADETLFDEICAVVDPFVTEINQIRYKHSSLEISHTLDKKSSELSLNVSIQFEGLKYSHGISFSCESSRPYMDNRPMETYSSINKCVTLELHRRFNVFQSACINSVDILNQFCKGKHIDFELYTPHDINLEALFIRVKRHPGNGFLFSIHIYKNKDFGDETVCGVISRDIDGLIPVSFFESVETYQTCISAQYDNPII